jgi:uncharacterized protein (DUF1330 family)
MPAPRKDLTKEVIQDLYNQGLSQRLIAEQLHTTQAQVSILFKRFDITARTQSEIMSGSNHWHWQGGRHQCKEGRGSKLGYIIVHNPTHPNTDYLGYVREHILVMEAHLGRYLTEEEEVHHINHIKTDNRLESLVLCANHTEHMKYHPKSRNPITGRFTKQI